MYRPLLTKSMRASSAVHCHGIIARYFLYAGSTTTRLGGHILSRVCNCIKSPTIFELTLQILEHYCTIKFRTTIFFVIPSKISLFLVILSNISLFTPFSTLTLTNLQLQLHNSPFRPTAANNILQLQKL